MGDEGQGGYYSDEIQGDVLPGFRGRVHDQFHQRFLFACVVADEVEQAREGLGNLLVIVSNGTDVAGGRAAAPERAFVNVAFTAVGLERFGRPSRDAVLTAGLAGRSMEHKLLGNPAAWRIGGPGSAVDLMINIGSVDLQAVEDMTECVRERLGQAFEFAPAVDGALLPEGREHFGFRDGLAQPFVAANVAAAAAPARDAEVKDEEIWPNWTALRLAAAARRAVAQEDEAEAALSSASDAHRLAEERARDLVEDPSAQEELAAAARRLAEATDVADKAAREARDQQKAADEASLDQVAVRGGGAPIRPVEQFVVRGGNDAFTENGSYMVWLQLEQDPNAFWTMCQDVADAVQAKNGGALDVPRAAALIVGRTLDGEPLEPLHDPERPEAFGYYSDPYGLKCPMGAHVRLTNPRDVESAGAMILRRGIPYGAPDAAERGLIFVCYQADIARQYETLQGKFANARYDPLKPVEDDQPSVPFPDFIISQSGREGHTIEIACPDGRGSAGTRKQVNTWVKPWGGLYLFVPSIKALHLLCEAGGR